jgi:hypothetical protein
MRAEQCALQDPRLRTHDPSYEGVSSHPLVKISLTNVRECNSFSAADSAQRKSALLREKHTERPAKGRAFRISSIMVADAV